MNSKKKLMKMLIITVIVGLLVVFGVIGFLTLKESSDPKVIAAKLEKEKQSNGYYGKIAELTSLMKQSTEYPATSIIEKITEVIGSTKINKIELGGVKGNYTFYIDDYILDVLIRGVKLEDIRIGNCLIYKRIANANDKSIIIKEKIYTFSEYDNIIKRLSKDMKVSKSVASKNFSILTSIGLNNFNNIKKIKTKEVGTSKYKGFSMNIPIEVYLTGETITKIDIVHKAIELVTVYDKNIIDDLQHIKNFIPVYGERKTIPDSLAYQVSQIMGGSVSIRFPVTLDDGDDSWLILKNGNEIYCEISGDVTDKKDTKNMKFIIKRDNSTQKITYLKVNKKVYVGKK